MDELRYRKPGVKTVLGITRIQKRLNKALGMRFVGSVLPDGSLSLGGSDHAIP